MNNSNPAVLIVDGDDTLLDEISLYLEMNGFNPFTATSAGEAINILEKNHIDVVVSDVWMSEMLGPKLVDYIKEKYKNIIIILMTGFRGLFSYADAYSLGIDALLYKPFAFDKLVAEIQDKLSSKIDSQRKVNS